MDDLQNEIENGGEPLPLIKEIKQEFAKCLLPMPSDPRSILDAEICREYCLDQRELDRIRKEASKLLGV